MVPGSNPKMLTFLFLFLFLFFNTPPMVWDGEALCAMILGAVLRARTSVRYPLPGRDCAGTGMCSAEKSADTAALDHLTSLTEP